MMNLSTIGIVGAGSWGTALALAIARQPEVERVLLWGRDPIQINTMHRRRENPAFLPGVSLPEAIEPTSHLEDLRQAGLVLIVVPSKGIRAVGSELANILEAGTPVLCCAKGIEHGSGLRMSEVLEEELPKCPVAVLSGPSHAEEVALGMPTALVLGCRDAEVGATLQAAISSQTLRIYTSTDVPGIELGGALKNIFAIAAGVGDGLGFGDNSKAALVTRALGELARVGRAMGGRPETFQGLSGAGDLMVTCFSRHSRNRLLGERLGRGESLKDILTSMTMVAEGVPVTLSGYECARRHELSTPLIDAMYALLYEGRSPQKLLEEILSREPKPEW